MALRERSSDNQIASLDVTEFSHRFENRTPPLRIAPEGDETDAIHPSCLLPLGSKRRGEDTSDHGPEKRAPVHGLLLRPVIALRGRTRGLILILTCPRCQPRSDAVLGGSIFQASGLRRPPTRVMDPFGA